MVAGIEPAILIGALGPPPTYWRVITTIIFILTVFYSVVNTVIQLSLYLIILSTSFQEDF